MVEYIFDAPGKEQYTMTGPEGYTEEQAIKDFNSAYVPPGQRAPQGMEAMAPVAKQDAEQMHAQFMRRQSGQAGPTDRPNSFLAGAGGSLTNIWNAGVQGLGHTANALGLKSDEELAKMEEFIQQNRQLNQILQKNNPGASAGGFAAENLAYAPLGTLVAPAQTINRFMPTRPSLTKEVPEWLGKARNRSAQFAHERPIATGAGIGTTVGLTQVSDDPHSYWGDKTWDAIRGTFFGSTAGKLQHYAQSKFGYDRSIDKAENLMETKVLGGKGIGNRATGEGALDTMKKLRDMNREEVTAAYQQARGLYKEGAPAGPDGKPIHNDIDMGGFLETLKFNMKRYKGKSAGDLRAIYSEVKAKVMEYNMPIIQKITKNLQRQQAAIKQQVASKTLTAQEGRAASQELTQQARDKISNLKQKIDIDQLDDLDKNINQAWKAGKQKEFTDKDGRYVRNANIMKDALGDNLQGQRAEGVFAVGKWKFENLKKGRSITVAGKEIPLLNWIQKAKPEEIFQKIFREGSQENIEQAKAIFLKMGDEGKQAWNNLRSRMFADIYGEANNWYKGSKIINPDDFQHQLDRVGKEKLDMLFSKEEQGIMQKLATVDDRTMFDMVHAMFKGPRLTYSGRFFREGASLLLRMTFQSKETAGFAQAVAKATGRGKIPKWRKNLEGTMKRLSRPLAANVALGDTDERRADHTMTLVKSMARSATNKARETLENR